jgi:serine protease inhibitor
VNQQLKNIKGITLKIANSVFLSEGHKLNEQYAAISRDVFNSEVKQVNFAQNVEAAATINQWVRTVFIIIIIFSNTL